MGDDHTYQEREAEGRAALQTALAAAFAVRQVEAQSTLCLYGAAVPAFGLWVHAWHPLPELLAWLAAMGWVFFSSLAVALTGIAFKRRLQLARAMPQAARIACLHFRPSAGDPVPFGSTLLIWLATAAGAVLCLHAFAPLWVRADLVQVSYRIWLILLAGALGCRYLEAS